MYRSVPLFLLLPLLLLTGGCDLFSPSPERQQSLLPLAVGNEWVFRSTTTYTTGSPPASRLDTIRVVSDTTVGSETWYHLTDTGQKTSYYVTLRVDGVWKDLASPRLLYRYPATAGQTYAFSPDESIQVVRTDASISVPAGTFSAFHYRFLRERIDLNGQVYENTYPCDYYLAPGIGWVSMTTRYIWLRSGDKLELAAVEERELLRVHLE